MGDSVASLPTSVIVQGARVGLVRIADVIVGDADGLDKASVDVLNIRQDLQHLFVISYARSSAALAIDSIRARFNGDAVAGHYDEQILQGSGAAATAGEDFGTKTSAALGLIAGATAGANLFDGSFVLIPNYADARNNKNLVYITWHKSGVATGNMNVRQGGGAWRVNANIVDISFFATTGNLKAFSRISVYGFSG